MTIDNDEIDKVVSVVLHSWHELGLLLEDQYDSISDKILARNESILSLLKKFNGKIENDLVNFKTNMEKLGFSVEDMMWNHLVIMSQLALAQSEALKRFLISILDKQKIFKNGNRKFYEYGYLIKELSNKITDPKFRKCFEDIFNVELRNALAHDDWWFENRKFVFRDKHKKIVEYDFGKFMEEVKKINSVTRYFVYRYLENYRKSHQSFQHYNQLGFEL